jgi:hypothetical protein
VRKQKVTETKKLQTQMGKVVPFASKVEKMLSEDCDTSFELQKFGILD